MFHRCILPICGLAIAMSSAAIALGQYSSPSSGSAFASLSGTSPLEASSGQMISLGRARPPT